MLKKIILFILFLYGSPLFSQNDCSDAIIVCGNSGFQNLDATGVGIQELNGNNTCNSEENNSIWFKVNIKKGGTLGFTIIPTNANGTTNNDITVDFDFFIFGPNVSCGNMGQAIRCSTTNPQLANLANNLTGMNGTETDTSEGPGDRGSGYIRWLTTNDNDSYFIAIDRPVGSSNFKLEWNGTATFYEPPTATSPSPGTSYDIELCDTDGVIDNSTTFNLTTNEASILNNQTNINISYHLSNSNAITNSNRINTPTSFQNTSSPQEIFVRLTNTISSCYVVSSFNLKVPTQPVANHPIDYQVCDDPSADGIFNNFILNTKDTEVLATQDPTLFNVSYHLTQNEANTNANSINKTTPYTNTTINNQTIFVRIENKNSTNCFQTTSFNLKVNSLPIVNNLLNIKECDIDSDGIANFNLSINTNEALATQTGITVSYHNNQNDADSNSNPIINPNNYPNNSNPETIYIRLTNNASNCFTSSSFEILATSLPTPQTPTDYTICDDATVGTDTDGFINHFKLNTKDTEVLGTLDPAIYKVSYHTTLVGAQTDNTTNLINKTINYTNTIANSQPIYVRVENVNNTNCNDTSKSFNLIVNPLPIITTNVELKQCDNDVDGFTPFNLNEAITDISVNHANETFTFFPTLADAVADNNQIPNPTTFVNRVIPSDKVWARATSTFGCYRISEIKLTVSTTGIPATFQKSFNTCDDFLDIDGNNNANNNDTDGISTFNFNNVTAEVIAIFPANQQLTVTYYKNENDALAEENPIADPANYRNIGYPNTQNIYIRVDSNLDNDCLGFGHHITLTVDKNPTATPVTNLEICDDIDDGDGTNGIVQTFNLTSKSATILGTQNPANFTVTYHTSKNDANAGTNAIPTPNAYTNTTRDKQTVYVRVTNNNGGCFTDHTSFDLIVNPLPIANFAPNIEICDDDSDGSAHNGFSQTINLENNTNTVLGTQDPTIFSVTYHRSLADAQSGSKPLLSPYTNKTQNREKIWVRVYNANTGCANGISNFDVIINPEPIPNPQNTLSNLSYCDDDNGGIASDTDAIYENIDLESQIPDILGADNTLPNYQNPDDFTVTFHKNQADASSGNNPFASPYTNTNRTETIFVRIENKATHCSNDDVTFQVIINQLPDFQVTSPQIVCLNKLPKNIAIENPDDVYDYQWKDENGTTIGTNNTSLDISVGGVYSVTATTTNGTNCSRTRTIQVNESIIATLVENDITIIDDSDNNTITINSANNHLGVGKYEFALTDQKDNFIRTYQDDPVFENLDGNIYKVLVRDKNDCGEVSLLVPVIEIPKFFTPNSDGINDIWKIKGVNTTFFPVSKIVIFDRYGKAVGNIKTNDQGWNGNYNGKILPSDDYWFSIKLVDANGIKRERKGHFSLLRK